MSQINMPPTKNIINTLYHSAILTGFAIAYSVIGKKLIKLDVGDPAKPDLFDFVKLTTVITLSVATSDWLIEHKIIPGDLA
jgi:energy-converting hydrogenase Eha subunit G